MKFSFEWSNAINPDRRDIVFENRNKEYGGYALRRDYQRRVVFALIITLFGIGLAVTAPMIISFLSKVGGTKEVKVTEGIVLEEPPPIDKSTPPPPPVIPPPPVQQTIKFTPPKVVKDEEVEEPPTQEETKEVAVSTETHVGENIPELPPEPTNPDEGKIFTVVEEMPSFPGGEGKLMEYLSHIKYP